MLLPGLRKKAPISSALLAVSPAEIRKLIATLESAIERNTRLKELYEEILADTRHHAALGYETAWLMEHHFSDYFPDPNPLMMISHLAALEPDLRYGTCVLVTPWADPLRMAEEIAMLTQLCRHPLELGLGRGTASLEYDAFGVDMSGARDRFDEAYAFLTKALTGAPFSHDGSFYPLADPIRVRPTPRPDHWNFYGALGSPISAEYYGRMGLAPMLASGPPFPLLAKTIETWRAAAAAAGHATDARMPIQVITVVEETDEKAMEAARTYLPRFGQAQVDHYRIDTTDWESIPGYESFKKSFGVIKRLADPANMDRIAPHLLVGSPDTVHARLEQLVELGLDKFMIYTAMPGIPRAIRQGWATNFAKHVAPAFSGRFG